MCVDRRQRARSRPVGPPGPSFRSISVSVSRCPVSHLTIASCFACCSLMLSSLASAYATHGRYVCVSYVCGWVGRCPPL